MQIIELPFPELILFTPKRFFDSRGFFTELFNAEKLASLGIKETFVQDNFSLSERAGTVRGFHFQAPPYAQAKLVHVGHGSILDVVIDLRRSSPTYGQHVAVQMSAVNGRQLYIPEGFAHGFCTLAPNTEVVYKVSSYYAPEAEGGIRWSDPDLKIDWPVGNEDAIVSEKDAKLPLLKDLAPVF
ncbi:dTDP-4-dehydrorhamnose 3,5-epimerase [Hyphomicrobium sp.]|uniref:dTDP-4-dehydrorhamnose 3,5-epimerase n=1 Tax=Hyphomicrobium sp. TaxID=82 RepID=UPI000FA25263|nr:dTDP-4-dehydrorhamnose 3,5-epimerase [Hyphomicrobium sp.]RUO97850.1 MAG: dTDP-4-dehydrorhamnose 3,5-epimerase [Hyphomicrobium sp.]